MRGVFHFYKTCARLSYDLIRIFGHSLADSTTLPTCLRACALSFIADAQQGARAHTHTFVAGGGGGGSTVNLVTLDYKLFRRKSPAL